MCVIDLKMITVVFLHYWIPAALFGIGIMGVLIWKLPKRKDVSAIISVPFPNNSVHNRTAAKVNQVFFYFIKILE